MTLWWHLLAFWMRSRPRLRVASIQLIQMFVRFSDVRVVIFFFLQICASKLFPVSRLYSPWPRHSSLLATPALTEQNVSNVCLQTSRDTSDTFVCPPHDVTSSLSKTEIFNRKERPLWAAPSMSSDSPSGSTWPRQCTDNTQLFIHNQSFRLPQQSSLWSAWYRYW